MNRKFAAAVAVLAAAAFGGLYCVSNPAVVRDESRSVKQSNPVQLQSSPTSQAATAGRDIEQHNTTRQGVSDWTLFAIVGAVIGSDLVQYLALRRNGKRA